MIQVVLPEHLRTLSRVNGEVDEREQDEDQDQDQDQDHRVLSPRPGGDQFTKKQGVFSPVDEYNAFVT